MNRVQIVILGILSTAALCIITVLVGSIVFLVIQKPPEPPSSAPVALPVEKQPSSTATSIPTIELPNPTNLREPTATNTRVVMDTPTVMTSTPVGAGQTVPTPTYGFSLPVTDEDHGFDSPEPFGCCKVCTKGKACGDTCISRDKICTKSPGCAC